MSHLPSELAEGRRLICVSLQSSRDRFGIRNQTHAGCASLAEGEIRLAHLEGMPSWHLGIACIQHDIREGVPVGHIILA
jgi:hypothetical protein